MKTEPLVKVVKAPHTWKCGRCGAVIRRGEECVKVGKEKMCAKHISEMKGGES